MAKAKLVSSGGSGLAAVLAKVVALDRFAVSVGIHESAGMHDEAGVTVAQVGAWNEYGTERIPERSFMRTTMNERRREHRATIFRIVKRVLKGDDARRLMGLFGQQVQNQVQAKIVSIQEPPNAESTIKRKKSSNPLVDSEQMISSVRWEYLNVGDVD
ncbi:MAG: hypothetical protein ACRCXB_07570 [Aeromonadaceae bacterium]